MADSLGYATPQSRTQKCGVGYALLLAWNLLLVAPAGFVFAIGVSGDSFAPMICMVVGVPVAVGASLLGTAPAVAYGSSNASWLSRRATWWLLAPAIAAPAISGIGVFLSFVLPTTHGSHC